MPNILFSKTGYTVLAGGNLTIIFKDKMKHDIAITVLGSTISGRFSDMEKLVNISQLSYTK
jgi:D-alanyl-D-alanine carboxypeptidase